MLVTTIDKVLEVLEYTQVAAVSAAVAIATVICCEIGRTWHFSD